MIEPHAIQVCGRSLVSPWGIGVERLPDAPSSDEGRSVAGGHRGTGPTAGPRKSMIDFELAPFLPKLKGLREFDRTSLLLAVAAGAAIEDAGESILPEEDTGLAVGSTYGTIGSIAEFDRQAIEESPSYVSPTAFPNTVLNAPAGRVARLFGLRGVNATISTGEASGIDALIYACEWLRSGRSRSFVVGSAFGRSPAVVQSLGADVAEAAGAFVLATRPAESTSIHGSITGFETAFLPTSEDGVALGTRALRRALERAGIESCQVGLVIGGGPGPRSRPDMETEVLDAVFGPRRPAYLSQTHWTGDCLDANGAIRFAMALRALDRSDSRVLVSAFSRSGHCSFLVVKGPGGTSA